MLIVWGSTHIRRKNEVRVYAQCPHCHQVGAKACYDASKFFTLYMVPLIPLGKVHVAQECPGCKQGLHASLSKWEQQRDAQLPSAVAAYLQHPDFAPALAHAVELALAFHDESAFLEVALQAEEHFAQTPASLLQLAAGYRFFGLNEPAQAALEAALALDTTAQALRLAFVWSMQDRKPGAAGRFVDELRAKSSQDVSAELRLLIPMLQALGQHDEAILRLDQLVESDPTARMDKQVAKWLKLAQKHAGSNKPVGKVSLAGLTQPNAKVTAGNNRLVPGLIMVGLVVLLLAGIFAGMAFFAPAHHIYVVAGGVPQGYQVAVNGQSFTLAPNQAVKVPMQWGKVTIAPQDAPWPLETVTLETKAGFFERAFDQRIWVVNLDRIAPIFWHEVGYGVNPQQVEVLNQSKLYVGQSLYRFDHIQYPFADFPEQVKMSSGQTSTTRRGLELVDAKPMFVGFYLHDPAVKPPLSPAEYLLLALRYHPTDEMLLDLLSATATPEQFRSVAQAKLDERPVLLTWHLRYQRALSNANQTEQMVAAYQTLWAEDQQDPVRNYLLALALDDQPQSEALYQAAANHERPVLEAHQALAQRRMLEGDFAAAAPHARALAKLQDESEPYDYLIYEVALASGQFDDYLPLPIRDENLKNYLLPAVAEQVAYLAVQGHVGRAVQLKNRYLEQTIDSSAANAPALRTMYLRQFDLARAMADGNLTRCVELAKEGAKPEEPFHEALLAGQWEQAQAALGEDYSGDPVAAHLLLYLLAQRGGAEQVAALSYQTALESWEEEGGAARAAVAALRQAEGPALKRLPGGFDGERSRVLAAALALRQPQQRAHYRALALKLCYRPDYTSLLVRDLLRED